MNDHVLDTQLFEQLCFVKKAGESCRPHPTSRGWEDRRDGRPRARRPRAFRTPLCLYRSRPFSAHDLGFFTKICTTSHPSARAAERLIEPFGDGR